MTPTNPVADLLRLLDRVPTASLARLLWQPGFDVAIHLTPTDALVERLAPFAEDPDCGACPDELREVDGDNLDALAQRLLLGRHADGLRRLTQLWQANGTPAPVVERAARAASEAVEGWPTVPGTYSSTFVDFVRELGTIEREDRDGPLGRAIRKSRFRGAGETDRSRPPLVGEAEPGGFPVVLPQTEGTAFRRAVWVCPESRDWPEWAKGLVPRGEQRRAARQRPLDGPAGHFDKLRRDWQQLRKHLLGQADVPHSTLPGWLVLAVLKFGLETLESAGLSLGLDHLARRHNWPLPAGIGFTGRLEPSDRLENASLRPVSDIAEKLRAARETGLFVLFACCERPPEVSERGITLVPLPEGSLEEVVRRVNTTCAEMGLTEHRWQWASRRLLNRLRPTATGHGVYSQLLPDVGIREGPGAEALPVGFVGRQLELRHLNELQDGARRAPGRLRRAVEADPRTGKTTLLGHWLHDRERWPRFPAWFSFQRGRQGSIRTEDLEAALAEQLTARFCVLLDPRAEASRGGLRWARQAREVLEWTKAAADVVVDGLDEADFGARDAIIDCLAGLEGRGLLLVGSQPLAKLRQQFGPVLHIGDASQHAQRDAEELIRRFEERFRRQTHLREQADQLASPAYREEMARRAGKSLWMLTDFLLHVESDRAGLPEDPADTILTPSIEDYCRRLVAEILRACSDERDRKDLRTLFVGLAILEERCWPAIPEEERWPLDGVLDVLDLTDGVHRWEGLLAEHAGRLVALSRQRVRLREAAFRQALLKDHPIDRRQLAERLVDVLRRPADDSLAYRYAVGSAARHVFLDDEISPALAASLLFNTPWASQRLRSLVPARQSVNEVLRELERLRPLVERCPPSTPSVQPLAALEALQRGLAFWRQGIDQSRECMAQWWKALVEPQQFACWSGQEPPSDLPGAPLLLLPAGPPDSPRPGYGVPHWLRFRFSGPVCELPGTGGPGALVFAAEGGFLLLYEYNSVTGGYQRRGLMPLGLRSVRSLVALGGGEVVVLAEDWAGNGRLLQVNVRSDVVTSLDHLEWGNPVAVACLEPAAPGGPPRLVVAAHEGECTKVGILEDGRTTGVPLAELPFRIEGLVKFAPLTWAAYRCGYHPLAIWGEQPDPTCRDWLVLQTLRDRQIVDIPLANAANLQRIGVWGVCQGPRETLAVQVFASADRMRGFLYSRQGERVGFTDVLNYSVLEGRFPAFPSYGAAIPLAWNDQFGLLMTNDVQGIISLCFETGAVPRYLPRHLEAEVPGAMSGIGLPMDGLRLSDGRSLLVYQSGAVIIEGPDSPVVRIGEPGDRRPQTHIVGARPDGSLLLEENDAQPVDPDDWRWGGEDIDIGDIDVGYIDEGMTGDEEEPLPKPAVSLAYSPGQARREEDATQVRRGFEQTASDGRCYRLERTKEGMTLYRQQDQSWVRLWDLQDLRSRWKKVARHGGDRFHLLDVLPRGEDRWSLCVAFTRREGERSLLWVCPVDLSAAAGTWSPAGEPSRLDLGEEVVTSCTVIDPNHFAVGYESGRIEVISLTPDREGHRQTLAVAFPLSAPTDLKVSRSERGVYLAAVAEGLVWFDLSPLRLREQS